MSFDSICKDMIDCARRQAFVEAAVMVDRNHDKYVDKGRIQMVSWDLEKMAIKDIEVRPEAIRVCEHLHNLERYCSGIHCDRCLAVRELDQRYGREVTNLALQWARVEGTE